MPHEIIAGPVGKSKAAESKKKKKEAGPLIHPFFN
jgi:precorrin isomerase